MANSCNSKSSPRALSLSNEHFSHCRVTAKVGAGENVEFSIANEAKHENCELITRNKDVRDPRTPLLPLQCLNCLGVVCESYKLTQQLPKKL